MDPFLPLAPNRPGVLYFDLVFDESAYDERRSEDVAYTDDLECVLMAHALWRTPALLIDVETNVLNNIQRCLRAAVHAASPPVSNIRVLNEGHAADGALVCKTVISDLTTLTAINDYITAHTHDENGSIDLGAFFAATNFVWYPQGVNSTRYGPPGFGDYTIDDWVYYYTNIHDTNSED